MSEAFDPYLHWLGIREPQRPPNCYRLLGLDLFESDPDVLANAVDRQTMHLRMFLRAGPHAAEAQRLLEEVSAAGQVLLNPQRKAEYDGAVVPGSGASGPSSCNAGRGGPADAADTAASSSAPAGGAAWCGRAFRGRAGRR